MVKLKCIYVGVKLVRPIMYLVVCHFFLETKCNQGHTIMVSVTKNSEMARLFQLVSKMISSKRQVVHDVLKSTLPETDKDVIL